MHINDNRSASLDADLDRYPHVIAGGLPTAGAVVCSNWRREAGWDERELDRCRTSEIVRAARATSGGCFVQPSGTAGLELCNPRPRRDKPRTRATGRRAATRTASRALGTEQPGLD